MTLYGAEFPPAVQYHPGPTFYLLCPQGCHPSLPSFTSSPTLVLSPFLS